MIKYLYLNQKILIRQIPIAILYFTIFFFTNENSSSLIVLLICLFYMFSLEFRKRAVYKVSAKLEKCVTCTERDNCEVRRFCTAIENNRVRSEKCEGCTWLCTGNICKFNMIEIKQMPNRIEKLKNN